MGANGRMKVAVETTPLYTSRAGVARYVRGLLRGLRGLEVPGLEILELGWPVENMGYAQPARAFKTIAREFGWARFVAPRNAAGSDVVHHTTLPVMPFFRGARHVVTLHDLAVMRHPERFRSWQRRSGTLRARRLLQADHIITVSEFTANEAMRLLSIPASKLTVTYEGASLGSTTAAPASTHAELPHDFFLFVGSLEPGKNLALLRSIYTATTQSLPPLVIAGSRWEGVPHEGPPPANWRFLGHVTDAELAALYRRARALLFPSKYEGFGLPVLEAMTLGCPVICGRVASLPEIGGEAPLYAELSTEAFAQAMHQVIADDNLRDAMIATGKKQAARFSWERCARETESIYRQAAKH